MLCKAAGNIYELAVDKLGGSTFEAGQALAQEQEMLDLLRNVGVEVDANYYAEIAKALE